MHSLRIKGKLPKERTAGSESNLETLIILPLLYPIILSSKCQLHNLQVEVKQNENVGPLHHKVF